MVSHSKYGCGNPGMDRSHPEESGLGYVIEPSGQLSLFSSVLPNSEIYEDCTTSAERFGALAEMLRGAK